MITVVNFSHPLSPEAAGKIRADYGLGKGHILDVRVQVDPTKPLIPQVEAIFAEACRKVGEAYGEPAAGHSANVDSIILPGLSAVAVPLANRFPTANIIVMAATPGVTPPKFMPVELIRSTAWKPG